MLKKLVILFVLLAASLCRAQKFDVITFDSGNIAGAGAYSTTKGAYCGLVEEVMVSVSGTGGVNVTISTLSTNGAKVARNIIATTGIMTSASFPVRQITRTVSGVGNAATTNAQVAFGLAEEYVQCVISNFNSAVAVTSQVSVLYRGN